MISTKHTMIILTEKDIDKRNELIDKLSEKDAKYLLKQCLSVMLDSKNDE